ncbi:MAG: FAD-dependent oxidoreductase [Arcicella sp.]|nr:FAD-dependent oxidoreductase [Arcicella sp.]
MKTNQYNIIIVGAGSAGMCCAIRAAERGRSVLVIEKDSIVGGTLYLTAGHMSAGGTRRQREKGIDDSPEKHFEEVMKISHQTANPAITKLATDLAPKTIDWLEDLGFDFAPETPAIIYGHAPYATPRTHWGVADYAGKDIKTTGISIYNTLKPLWDSLVETGKIKVFLNHSLTNLIQIDGQVVGVKALHDGIETIFHGQNVVLTTGGYAANPEFFKQVTPNVPRLISSARLTSTGDGIMVAQKIGAKFRGAEMHNSTLGGIELEPMSGRSDFWKNWARVSNSVDRKPREIYVNEQSERFMNEDTPNPDDREHIVNQQSNRRFWLIFDEKALNSGASIIPQLSVEQIKEETTREKAFWQADSVEELAQKMGLNPDKLSETVNRFNDLCDSKNDEDFGRDLTDSEMVFPIKNAPFYGILTYAYSLISFGGLAINDKLEVLNKNEEPIKGLYAAGEIIGVHATSGKAFCGGMVLTPALSFGKYLGEKL